LLDLKLRMQAAQFTKRRLLTDLQGAAIAAWQRDQVLAAGRPRERRKLTGAERGRGAASKARRHVPVLRNVPGQHRKRSRAAAGSISPPNPPVDRLSSSGTR